MSIKNHNNNNLFWYSKAGKNIISYGTLLIVCGILDVVFSFFIILYVRIEMDKSYITAYDIFLYLFIPLILSICLIICGLNIRKKLYSPDKLSSVNIVIIILELIAIPLNGRITIFGALILFDAICCQTNWLKKYRSWGKLNGNKE